MAKRFRSSRNGTTGTPPLAPSPDAGRFEAFTFGDPEPIDRASLLDYTELCQNGRWYEPPVSLRGLANMLRVAPHHSSAIYVKRNLLVAAFEETRYLSMDAFTGFATDYVTFDNAYLEAVKRASGGA